MFAKTAVMALLPTAFAAVHTVIVGQNNALTFTPSSVQANVGDQVKYVFANANHTVTSGISPAGCVSDAKFYSGFVPVSNPNAGTLPSFTINVADTNPQTVYCSQAQHCQSGMLMSINPTQSGPGSLVQAQRLASQAAINMIPTIPVTGGQLANLQNGAPAAGGAGNGSGNGAAGGAGGAGTGAGAAGGAKGAAGNGNGAGKGSGKGRKGQGSRKLVRSAKFIEE